MNSSKYFHEITAYSQLFDEISAENSVSPKVYKINEEAKLFENQDKGLLASFFLVDDEDKIIEEDLQKKGLKEFDTRDYPRKG